MDVTGIAFESMLGIDYRIGVLIGFAIVLIYIFIGGIFGVLCQPFVGALSDNFNKRLIPSTTESS